MNALLSHRWLILFLLSLGCLSLFTAAAFAASAEAATGSTLHASFMLELMGNRSRLIQVSLVFVTLGCALIWWYK